MAERNNVLMINVDEWPGRLIGYMGRNDIMTPTLDYLAERGIIFEECYSECPVCIPARRSIMTGLSPRSHGDRVYSDRMEMPKVPTLAETFRDNGYQTVAVGKLHVYPQRDRIGFENAIITEEGRYEFGCTDDYQIWLGEHGYVGEEFLHGMGNNTYYTRPWHLPEEAHPTNWVTKKMMQEMKRLDPTRPFFLYCSYQFPHPPLVPLQTFWDMYSENEMKSPLTDDWMDERPIMRMLREPASIYSQKEIRRARRAFYAQCTHIDNQIRLLIGTLRESGLLNSTIILFVSDHGDMLFDHQMVAKRSFYEGSAKVPLFITGKPVEKYKGVRSSRLVYLRDIMPTLLSMCNIPVPSTVEGISMFSNEHHPYLYGECGEGQKAGRMIRFDNYKLIYYPCGNVTQLFDLSKDPDEEHDLAGQLSYGEVQKKMTAFLIKELYGDDLQWLQDGKLVGFQPVFAEKTDYGLYNQRGYHWPQPGGYSNLGKNG